MQAGMKRRRSIGMRLLPLAAALLLMQPVLPAGAVSANQIFETIIPRVHTAPPKKAKKPRQVKRAPAEPPKGTTPAEAAKPGEIAKPLETAKPVAKPDDPAKPAVSTNADRPANTPDRSAAIPLPRSKPNGAAPVPLPVEAPIAEAPAPPDKSVPADKAARAREAADALASGGPGDPAGAGALAFAPPTLAMPLSTAPDPTATFGALGAIVTPGVSAPAAPEVAVTPPIARGTPLPREKPHPPEQPDVVLAAITPLPPPALPQALSACRAQMSGLEISAEALPPRHEGVCGADDPFAVASLQAGAVTLEPAPTINCEMASMLSRWVGDDVQPAAAAAYGGSVTALRIADSYSCRGRNRIVGAQLSEHAFMNAIDVSAFEIKGRWVTVEKSGDHTDADTAFIQTIRHEACARFMTVLGPGSDGYHENHLHLDMRHRGTHAGSRYCH